MTYQPTTRVWRYMSFAKLVWILQKKQLWLSSIKLLDDKWEGMLNTQQLNSLNRPISLSRAALKEAERLVKIYRETAFINCWNASEHESHALWRIYCPSSEGVAIQTTLDRLRKSVDPLSVLEVSYDQQNEVNNKLYIAQKRSMFAYEQEVRIVHIEDFSDSQHAERITIGIAIDWDPELHIEKILVHPEAQSWFMETVTETVRQLAPKLSRDGFLPVVWSELSYSPPF